MIPPLPPRPRPRVSWRLLLAAAFWCLLAALVITYLSGTWSHGVDDSFITYRYADNLRNGYGLAFNPGERHYGSTAMGFAVLLAAVSAALHLVGYGEIAAISHCLSALSLVVILTLVLQIIRASVRSASTTYVVGAIISLYVFGAAVFRNSIGHETYPFLALLTAGAFFVYVRHRYLSGAISLALALMLRPDGVLFIVITIAVVTARQYAWGDVGWGNIVLVVGLCTGVGLFWMVFTWWYFGSPIPETLYAKKAQVLLGHWPIFRLRTVMSGLQGHLTVTLGALVAGGALVTGQWLYGVLRDPAGIEPERRDAIAWSVTWFGFAVGLIVGYRALLVTYWPWYLVPIWLAILLGSVVAVVSAVGRYPRLGRALALVGLLGVMWDGAVATQGMRRWLVEGSVNLHLGSYDPIVAFLRREEPTGTVVANGEPGNLGYKLGPRYKVVDELGLASPGVARGILVGDLDYPFRRWRPDYVIVSFRGRYNPHERWWFERSYQLVGEFEHPFWRRVVDRGALLYRRAIEPDALEELIGRAGGRKAEDTEIARGAQLAGIY